tara:strand:+ start:241 stop:531 length:291 start_codon:yes stop_codon:yes gene_type:complete
LRLPPIASKKGRFFKIIDKARVRAILKPMTKPQETETRRQGRPRGVDKQHVGVMIPVALMDAVRQYSRESGKTLSFLMAEGVRELIEKETAGCQSD